MPALIVLSRPGDCHQLGEIVPRTKALGSIPRNAGGHHPGKDLCRNLRLPDSRQ